MCGFVGFTGNIVNRDKILRNMANRIIHRGPDMEGFHMSGNEPSDSVNLGFRRLSIIDLSDGAQPMYNEDGSVNVTAAENVMVDGKIDMSKVNAIALS